MKAYLEIEMPTSCGSCLFRRLWPEDDEVECIIEKTLWTKDAEKNPACPLVPVPPHGDLIDRDEMRETIKPWSPEDEMAGCTFDTVKKLMHTMISRAPVVIPAEEGEI